jgi:NADH dehydrogenase FAD-containing subunit
MSRPSVVVLGGGFAGLEAAFSLRRRLRDAVDLTLVSDRDHFIFRPHTTYIPFGADPSRFETPLAEPARRRSIRLWKNRVLGVDAGPQRVRLEGGTLPYDYLVIATGAAMRPEEIPGLREHAGALWMPRDMVRLRSRFERIVRLGRNGVTTEVVFLVPPFNQWTPPVYEMVLMLETRLRRERARGAIRLVLATAEEGYVQALGPRLDGILEQELLDRGIEGHRGHVVTAVEPGLVRFANGAAIRYDDLVALSPHVAAVRYDGLPMSERGFLRTAATCRAVLGIGGIFAVGDAGDFPVKQAVLALQQADAAAEAIAGAVLREGPRAVFEPVSTCVIDELDNAAFARVPLDLSGRPSLRAGPSPAGEVDHAGTSGLWRLGKKLPGDLVSSRFRAGRPATGAAWSLMDAGMRGLARVMAR